MNFLKRFVLIFAVSVACVGCDQTTKLAAQSVLSETRALSYFGDTVRLQLAYNDGAFLSLGSSLPSNWRLAIFSVGTGVLLLAALAYAFLCSPNHRLHVPATALLFAGGVGNLIDRVLHGGLVVDFINLGIGPLRTGIFNIADIAITVAVVIFLVGGTPGPARS